MPGTLPVPGVGIYEKQDIMLVGEALGEDESIMELPFVGLCGKFLDSMLIKAGLRRDWLYITNTVKCRPTKNNGKANRPPEDSEIQACKGWLWKEIKGVNPKAIITLGKVPTALLMKKKAFILGDYVGQNFKPDWFHTTIFPCYHPSYIMVRAKNKEEDVISVFKTVKEFVKCQ